MFNLRIYGIFKHGRLLASRRDDEAEIHTTALSHYKAYSYKYFWAVERGVNKSIAAQHAKAMRFYSRGRWWSKRVVAGQRAQNLRARALQLAMPTIKAMAATWRGSLADLVNAAAHRLTWALARVTPRRSGRLAKSYRIDPAK